MKNKKIIDQLNTISNLIKEEKYYKALDNIEKIKMELASEKEQVSEYLDKLVSKLR